MRFALTAIADPRQRFDFDLLQEQSATIIIRVP